MKAKLPSKLVSLILFDGCQSFKKAAQSFTWKISWDLLFLLESVLISPNSLILLLKLLFTSCPAI